MSIHPRFAQAILAGTKLVELRRVPFKRPVTHVFIYETGSSGAVVGLFEVKRVVEASPRAVWKTYNRGSGLT
jgi:predicted transcriptional regulator